MPTDQGVDMDRETELDMDGRDKRERPSASVTPTGPPEGRCSKGHPSGACDCAK